MLLPGRLLGPDRPVQVAAPVVPPTTSVQAAPPLVVRRARRAAPVPHALLSRSVTPAVVTRAVATSVTTRHTVVHTSPGRRLLQAHRSAVIHQLAPRAPLVRSRQLAAALASAPAVKAIAARRAPTLAARTITALGASLRKK